MKRAFRTFFILFATTLSLSTFAKSHGVDDRAGLFSAKAISRAEEDIQAVLDKTSTHKDVLVVTTKSLPEGVTAKKESERIFRSRQVNGVLIFIVKSPHRLVVTVGKETEKRFYKKDELRELILKSFKKNEYDNGLMAGTDMLHSELMKSFPLKTSRYRNRIRFAPFSISLGGADWWVYLLIVWGVVAFFGLFRGGMVGWGRGYRYGYGSGGGFLSGLFGAMTGAYLYDMFTGSRHYDSYSSSDSRYDSASSDDGDVGSSSSGDDDDSSSDSDSSSGDW